MVDVAQETALRKEAALLEAAEAQREVTRLNEASVQARAALVEAQRRAAQDMSTESNRLKAANPWPGPSLSLQLGSKAANEEAKAGQAEVARLQEACARQEALEATAKHELESNLEQANTPTHPSTQLQAWIRRCLTRRKLGCARRGKRKPCLSGCETLRRA